MAPSDAKQLDNSGLYIVTLQPAKTLVSNSQPSPVLLWAIMGSAMDSQLFYLILYRWIITLNLRDLLS